MAEYYLKRLLHLMINLINVDRLWYLLDFNWWMVRTHIDVHWAIVRSRSMSRNSTTLRFVFVVNNNPHSLKNL